MKRSRNRLSALAVLLVLPWTLRHDQARASAFLSPPAVAAIKAKPKKAPMEITPAKKDPKGAALALAARKPARGEELRERGEAFGGDRTESAATDSEKDAGKSDR